jgi:hypothetical protein
VRGVASVWALRPPDLNRVADGLNANGSLRSLPENASACVRRRSDAALLPRRPRRSAGGGGRARRAGGWAPRHRSPAIAGPAGVDQAPRRAPSRGARPRLPLVRRPRCATSAGSDRARPGAARPRYLPAPTDPELSAVEFIALYAARWAIEVDFQQAKGQLGVGQARNRARRAVERTVPFGFLCQTITICWYALHGDPEAAVKRRRTTAPWYRPKRSPSFADMLLELRRS